MDAPKSRYRVEEKNGRLTVIDTRTGQPAAPVSPPANPRAHPAPVASGEGLIDRTADALAALVATKRDAKGRAIIHWTWQKDGRQLHWDAHLDPAQQRRLGRALLGLAALPMFVVLVIFAGPSSLIWIPGLIAVLAFLRGLAGLRRLQRETQPPDA